MSGAFTNSPTPTRDGPRTAGFALREQAGLIEATKDGATKRINRTPREVGMLWQPRFFDRALRTVKEYNEMVGYIHLNPVKQDWWAGRKNGPGERACLQGQRATGCGDTERTIGGPRLGAR
jgi:hypothetical protein